MLHMSARVRLFGEFRNWCPSGEITVPVESSRTVSELKGAIAAELGKVAAPAEVDSLMSVSALAGEDRVLLDDETLAELGMRSFALLPPVCGG
jgi:hypothetical protein